MNYILVSLAIILMLSGFVLAIYIANSNGQLSFLEYAHWISLCILLISFSLSWVAMVWMTNPKEFKVESKQWIALGFTVLMAVFWWARYAFTVADTAKTAPK